jgi:hypothetical protein
MSRRLQTGRWGFLLLILALIVLGGKGSAWAQQDMGPLRLRGAVVNNGDGTYTLRWSDRNLGTLDPGALESLTWYYATRKDGSDRKRLTTLFRDEFASDFARRWRCEGAIQSDWIVRRDGRQFLSVPGGAVQSRAVSVDPLNRDVVVSTLVRPRDLKIGFSLALRVRPNGSGYLLTTSEEGLRLLDGSRKIDGRSASKINVNSWYWYEVGLRTRKDEVMVRVRVFDENRTKLLVSWASFHRPENRELTAAGGIALAGPADFAEVYADPWDACWLDARGNALDWNAKNVPDGEYYIIAEVADGKKPAYRVVSNFKVEIKNKPLAGMAQVADP